MLAKLSDASDLIEFCNITLKQLHNIKRIVSLYFPVLILGFNSGGSSRY